MAFQFKNSKTNQTYRINEIDEIVAKFWGKEVHPKHYAYPGEGDMWSQAPNWFDILGHAIEDLQYFTTKDDENHIIYRRSKTPRKAEFEMNEVAPMILCNFTRWSNSVEEFNADIESLKPYIELCFHLHSLDIIGVGCGW